MRPVVIGQLHSFVAGTRDNVHLLFLREVDELNCVARHANGEVLVFFLFRVFHSVDELFTTEHVHVHVVRALIEVTVENLNEVVRTFFFAVAKCTRVDRLGIADTVERPVVRNLGDRVEGSKETVLFCTVARVRARRAVHQPYGRPALHP